MEQEENQAQSVTNTEVEENVMASVEDTSLTTDNKTVNKDTVKESNTVAEASCEKTIEAPPPENGVDNVSNLPVECYHYYYGSNLDMGRLIEVCFFFNSQSRLFITSKIWLMSYGLKILQIRREWDAYLSPGGR